MPKLVKAVTPKGLAEVPDEQAELELPSAARLVGVNANALPLQSAVAAPRIFYGAKFVSQAIPVINRETPLVQNLDPDTNKSFDELLAKNAGAVFADEDGEVIKADNKKIVVKYASGAQKEIKLHDSFPFNRYTRLAQKPVVKPGDKIKAGQALAASNYTDDQGRLAIGVNAKTAVVPYLGYSMDDAIVVGENLAKKLTSEHVYQFKEELRDGMQAGRDHFISLFPKIFTNDQVANIDDNGVVKPGTVVKPGDPLLLATRPKKFTSMEGLGKQARFTRADASVVWEESYPAVVDKVYFDGKKAKIVVRGESPLQEGDKIVFRHGQKGIVSKILPEAEMPRDEKGEPYEVLLNPMSLQSRVNAATPYELLLGKIAKAQGAPVKLPSYLPDGQNWGDLIRAKLKELGLSDKSRVYDPKYDRWLEEPVADGYGYILKLHHVAAHKVSARGQGGYDANQQPVKGGETGAKRVSNLDVNALLSSGAYATLREAMTVRGTRNDEFWQALRMGQTPKNPGKPFVWEKFLRLLNGAGIEASERFGGKLRLGPFTDKHLEEKSPMEITSPETVDLNTLAPIKGGLFDPDMLAGKMWGYIRLPEPQINPVYEEGVRALLGVTKKELEDILTGQKELPDELKKKIIALRTKKFGKK